MSKRYYTFVGTMGDTLFHRYIQDGERHIEIVKNYPYELFTKSISGDYISLYGDKLKRIEFDTIYKLNDFVHNNQMENIFGNTSPIQQFISKEYEEVSVDEPLYKTISFDIEVNHGDGFTYTNFDTVVYKEGKGPTKEAFYKQIKNFDNLADIKVMDPFYKKMVWYKDSTYADQNIGFPKPEDAIAEILSITYQVIVGHNIVKTGGLGLKGYTGKSDIEYLQCRNEKELITAFINVFVDEQFDFITSWFGVLFDIPYLVTRARKIVGNAVTNKLSPFSAYGKNVIKENKRAPSLEYNIFGLTHLDYMALYKQYAKAKQERYTLDHISDVELGEKKVNYSEYKDSLMNLYCGVYDIPEETNIEELPEETNIEELPEKDRWARIRTMVATRLDMMLEENNDI